jgi:hypothetical protein
MLSEKFSHGCHVIFLFDSKQGKLQIYFLQSLSFHYTIRTCAARSYFTGTYFRHNCITHCSKLGSNVWIRLRWNKGHMTWLKFFILRKGRKHVRRRSLIAEAQVGNRGSPLEIWGGPSQWDRLFDYFGSPLSLSFHQYSVLFHLPSIGTTSSQKSIASLNKTL